jgi:hypothetical protein
MEKLDIKLHSITSEKQFGIILESLFGENCDQYTLNLNRIPIKMNLLAEKLEVFCENSGFKTIKDKRVFFGELYYLVRSIQARHSYNLTLENLIAISAVLDLEISSIVDWNEIKLKPELVLPKYNRIVERFIDHNYKVHLDSFFSLNFNNGLSSSRKFLKRVKVEGISVNDQRILDQKIFELRQQLKQS